MHVSTRQDSYMYSQLALVVAGYVLSYLLPAPLCISVRNKPELAGLYTLSDWQTGKLKVPSDRWMGLAS